MHKLVPPQTYCNQSVLLTRHQLNILWVPCLIFHKVLCLAWKWHPRFVSRFQRPVVRYPTPVVRYHTSSGPFSSSQPNHTLVAVHNFRNATIPICSIRPTSRAKLLVGYMEKIHFNWRVLRGNEPRFPIIFAGLIRWHTAELKILIDGVQISFFFSSPPSFYVDNEHSKWYLLFHSVVLETHPNRFMHCWCWNKRGCQFIQNDKPKIMQLCMTLLQKRHYRRNFQMLVCRKLHLFILDY